MNRNIIRSTTCFIYQLYKFKALGIPVSMMKMFYSAIWNTSEKLVATDSVLPQSVPLGLKFSSDEENREYIMYDVLGTIESYSVIVN